MSITNAAANQVAHTATSERAGKMGSLSADQPSFDSYVQKW